MSVTDHEGESAAAPVLAPVSTGKADHDEVTHLIASRMLTSLHEDAPGLYGHYLLKAMGLPAPTAPSKSQRQAAPDAYDRR